MNIKELLKDNLIIDIHLKHTQVYTKFITPLFTRDGKVNWMDFDLRYLQNSDPHWDAPEYLRSVVLKKKDIATMEGAGHNYKHVRIFLIGCDTVFYIDDTIEPRLCDNRLLYFCTNDEDDWNEILKIEDN